MEGAGARRGAGPAGGGGRPPLNGRSDRCVGGGQVWGGVEVGRSGVDAEIAFLTGGFVSRWFRGSVSRFYFSALAEK